MQNYQNALITLKLNKTIIKLTNKSLTPKNSQTMITINFNKAFETCKPSKNYLGQALVGLWVQKYFFIYCT